MNLQLTYQLDDQPPHTITLTDVDFQTKLADFKQVYEVVTSMLRQTIIKEGTQKHETN